MLLDHIARARSVHHIHAMIVGACGIVVDGKPLLIVQRVLRVVDRYGWAAPCRAVVISPRDEYATPVLRAISAKRSHVDAPIVTRHHHWVALDRQVGRDAGYLYLSFYRPSSPP